VVVVESDTGAYGFSIARCANAWFSHSTITVCVGGVWGIEVGSGKGEREVAT
jgi:hypothetical protein